MARPGFLHLPLQGLKAGVNHTLFFTGVPKYSINLCLLPGAQSVLSVFQQRRCFHIWGAACTLSFPGERIFSPPSPLAWLMDSWDSIRPPQDHWRSDGTRYLETVKEALPGELKKEYIDVQHTKLPVLPTGCCVPLHLPHF